MIFIVIIINIILLILKIMEVWRKMEVTNLQSISRNHYISGQIEIDDIEDLAVFGIKLIINNDNNNIIIQNIAPNSSAITGKIKSVCASDILFFIMPSPGPFPKKPPDSYAEKEFFIWSMPSHGAFKKQSILLLTWANMLYPNRIPHPNKLNDNKNHLNDKPDKNNCPDQISIIITDIPKSG